MDRVEHVISPSRDVIENVGSPMPDPYAEVCTFFRRFAEISNFPSPLPVSNRKQNHLFFGTTLAPQTHEPLEKEVYATHPY